MTLPVNRKIDTGLGAWYRVLAVLGSPTVHPRMAWCEEKPSGRLQPLRNQYFCHLIELGYNAFAGRLSVLLQIQRNHAFRDSEGWGLATCCILDCVWRSSKRSTWANKCACAPQHCHKPSDNAGSSHKTHLESLTAAYHTGNRRGTRPSLLWLLSMRQHMDGGAKVLRNM